MEELKKVGISEEEMSSFKKKKFLSFGELYENTFKKFDKLKSLGYTTKYIWENDWKKFKSGLDKNLKIQVI